MDKKKIIAGVVFAGIILLVAFWSKLFPLKTLETKGKLYVVTTVAPLTNIVYNVGGDRIDLHGIIPEGTDSHTFEPAPSDAKVLSRADIIFFNGLHLESPTEKLAKANKKPSTPLIYFGDQTISKSNWVFDFSFPEDKGDPNPHLWMNPVYARRYVEIARDELVKADPLNASYYEQNTKQFIQKIDQLDQVIQSAVQTIPAQNRKLLTYHDSWTYFARRYGFEVIGAIQPSDFSEPSPQDVANLITQLKQEHVPAIFGSEVFPSKVLNQIAKEVGIQWISTLRDDDLPGEKNSPEHTYIGMMVEDVRTMTTALGGDAKPLMVIDPSNNNQQ